MLENFQNAKSRYRITVTEEKKLSCSTSNIESNILVSDYNLSSHFTPNSKVFKKKNLSKQILDFNRSLSDSIIDKTDGKKLSNRSARIVGVKKADVTCSTTCLIY